MPPAFLDKLMSRLPRAATAQNITVPDTSFGAAEQFAGIKPVHNVDRVRPNIVPVDPTRHASPPVMLNGQFLPPGLRTRVPKVAVGTSPGLKLGHLIAPGQSVRKGIVHPGRRLGHTGNPNVGVPGQSKRKL